MPFDDPSRETAAEVPQAAVSEAEAWAEVVQAWDDEAAHRRYLARFQSLDALSVAGGRYKAVVAERPGDGMAQKMRAEILKKATAYGLAALPRTPAEPSKHVRRLRMSIAAFAGAVVVYVVYLVIALLTRSRS